MDLTDTDLDHLVRSVDPFPDGSPSAPVIALALEDLLEPLVTQGIRTQAADRRRPRRRRMAVAAVATVVVAAGGVAAAAGIDPFVNTDSSDFAASVRAATTDLPLPPGDDIDHYIAVWEQGPTGDLDRAHLVVYFSYDAACAWEGYWLQERTTTDTAATRDALQQLEQIPDWPQWPGNTGTDVITQYRTDATQAAAGDPTGVRQNWTANCTDLPRAWATK